MNKLLLAFTISILVISCKDNKEVLNTEYLGAPKYSDIQLRFIPAKFIEKNIPIPSGNGQQQASTHIGFLSTILESSPSLTELGENIFTFQPDLSVNWLINTGVTDSSKFASIYFKIGNVTALEKYLEEKKITAEVLKGTNISWVDDQSDEHNLIIRDDNHLLILKVLGSKTEALRILNDAIYDSKNSFLAHFKTTFNGLRNDLDIRLSPHTSISNLIPNRFVKDLVTSFDGLLSFQMKSNYLELTIDPLDSKLPIDSILEPSAISLDGIISFGTKINLVKLEKLLLKYNFLNDLEYQLKQSDLDFNKLKERSNGEVNMSYLGKKMNKVKSITYEFDDNFNEIEKVNYTESSSRDLNGFIGTNNTSLTKDWLLKNQIISNTGRNKFEPILLSKSEVHIGENKITIGDTINKTNTEEAKLLVNLNYSADDWQDLPAKELQKIEGLKTAKLEIDKNNKIVINISFIEEAFQYVKIIEKVMNP